MPHHHMHAHAHVQAPTPQPAPDEVAPAPDGAALLVFAAMLIAVVGLIVCSRSARRVALLLPPRGKPLQIPYLRVVK